MRANAAMPESIVAVVTKHPKPERPSLLPQSAIKVVSPWESGFPLSAPATVDVVKAEKFDMGFPAASAFCPAVSTEGCFSRADDCTSPGGPVHCTVRHVVKLGARRTALLSPPIATLLPREIPNGLRLPAVPANLDRFHTAILPCLCIRAQVAQLLHI